MKPIYTGDLRDHLNDKPIRFYRVATSWRRSDPDGFGVWVVSNTDFSPAVFNCGNYPRSQYDPDCHYCYLGHTHSQEAHDKERLDATGQNFPFCGEDEPIGEQGMANLTRALGFEEQ